MTLAMVAWMIAATGCTSGDDTSDTTTSLTVPSAPTTVPATSSTTSTQPTTTSTATATTTLPEPPHLEVLDPVHGATVTTARYTFNGVTDPGCTVTVGGKYEATVEEDGTWALDLMLEPGRNSTTFTATHPTTGMETTQAIRVYYAESLELRADGLGAVWFGQDESTTMAILSALLGPPVTETLCADEVLCRDMGYGWCRHVNAADWPESDLSILTADCEDLDDGWPDAPEFTTWYVGGGSTLRTPEGVGPGSTLAELRAVYGDRLVVGYADSCGGLYFYIHAPDGGDGVHGHIPEPSGFEPPEHDPEYPGDPSGSGLGLDPATGVFGFEAGWGQSC
jgi:hypothetical protein